MSVPVEVSRGEALGLLSRFRLECYDSHYAHVDALFKLIDAVLCADGLVRARGEVSMAAEHQPGRGAMYAALDQGWMVLPSCAARIAATYRWGRR
ncbi:hypothetical protein JIX56_46525 [Streptomyces sp. CA-210063]|uniref:hypothetical protein n=1 Tax=Streptomyces sp. CA-210063 TaxID=2801029 RepID=UPI00214C1054|nr:hypothetical protein [Streptomyces sp. CA-210063]UUU36672.1 hypothetical protein JIX56_46525 [Streptomyces sp. CA-210063]